MTDPVHNALMAYVLDFPEDAAREIARLRAGKQVDPTWVILSFLAGFLFGLWFF